MIMFHGSRAVVWSHAATLRTICAVSNMGNWLKNYLRPVSVPGEINFRPKYIFLRPGDVGSPLVSSPVPRTRLTSQHTRGGWGVLKSAEPKTTGWKLIA